MVDISNLRKCVVLPISPAPFLYQEQAWFVEDPKTHLMDLIWWTLLSTRTIEIPFQSQVSGHL